VGAAKLLVPPVGDGRGTVSVVVGLGLLGPIVRVVVVFRWSRDHRPRLAGVGFMHGWAWCLAWWRGLGGPLRRLWVWSAPRFPDSS